MNLSVKIFISLLLAIAVALVLSEDSLPFINWWIAPVGTIFINLIKMMIVPMIFTSLVVGMTSLGDTRKLGRIGLKTVCLYLVTNSHCHRLRRGRTDASRDRSRHECRRGSQSQGSSRHHAGLCGHDPVESH